MIEASATQKTEAEDRDQRRRKGPQIQVLLEAVGVTDRNGSSDRPAASRRAGRTSGIRRSKNRPRRSVRF